MPFLVKCADTHAIDGLLTLAANSSSLLVVMWLTVWKALDLKELAVLRKGEQESINVTTITITTIHKHK